MVDFIQGTFDYKHKEGLDTGYRNGYFIVCREDNFKLQQSMWDVELKGICSSGKRLEEEVQKRDANFVAEYNHVYILCKLPDKVFQKFKDFKECLVF